MKEFRTAFARIRLLLLLCGLLLVVAFSGILGAQLGWADAWLSYEQAVEPEPWRPRDIATDLSDQQANAGLIRLGHDLITRTPELIGPLAEDVSKRFAGNNLTCQNCHLKAGTQAGAGSFVGVYNRFPQFRARENKEGSLFERIDGCMERSMNGIKLPADSEEMKAMVAYMQWLSEEVPVEEEEKYKGFTTLELPEIKADLIIGEAVFKRYCVACHGENGQGIRAGENTMYQYPPLWGSDSYNHGAGMHRVITAAEFIKANMPYLLATYDKPVLTDEEAYHVAAYINSFERPQKHNAQADFPDVKLKPVSTPYGPWADTFPAEQHKYGPFQPIMRFYEQRYNIKKNK
ncbi:c-type cytochrome [Roseivirga thermotolerans]|uniref:c-type cytochrome n=1 Tax=Roseivirga thermotolerans TaxID=1758176 RepID=UPI00274013BE|nr:c-type cytochrome [Roseivirga thermotolerans]